MIRYPDRIPQDKIPQDKIPTDKIPQDRIPQDKIPQPEKWTKSHNMKKLTRKMDWNCFGELASLTNSIVLAWKGLLIISARHFNLQRVPPRFPHELWNITRSVSQLGTSDEQPVWGVEQPILSSGWLQSSVNAIQMENRKVVTLIAQDLIGRKRIRRQYVSLQTRLLTLWQDRVAGRRTIDEFLTGIRHNIRWTPSNRHAE